MTTSARTRAWLGQRTVAVLYGLVVFTFAILEPWGNVDTRDFSYMGKVRFWEYNAYILFVLAVMLVLAGRLWRGRAGLAALAWMAAVNAMFIVMCVFDMLHFFPDPAQSMPFWVWVIEGADSMVIFAITLAAPSIARRAEPGLL